MGVNNENTRRTCFPPSPATAFRERRIYTWTQSDGSNVCQACSMLLNLLNLVNYIAY